MKKINSFRGKYYFLSNFSNSKITMNGISFLNGEAAFHSFKDLSVQREFSNLNPSDAKRKGRRVNLRTDWEEIKESIMLDVVRAKFSQNADLKRELLSTSDSIIVEENTWHDNHYGNCICTRCKNIQGKNILGKILMKVRNELK